MSIPSRNQAPPARLALLGGEISGEFRANQIRQQLGPKHISVREAFFVSIDSGPENFRESEHELRKLLRAPDHFQFQKPALLVVPRRGVVSPWSSKATDIARRCGFAVGRIERGTLFQFSKTQTSGPSGIPPDLLREIHDPMTQRVLQNPDEWESVFAEADAVPLRTVPLGGNPARALADENQKSGLALSAIDIARLAEYFAEAGRDPADAELLFFAQANSEHCRHKIFRAPRARAPSLMDAVRQTFAVAPDGVVTAFSDNAAVIRAGTASEFAPDENGIWRAEKCDEICVVAKAETHNHPTAISPFPGAATGGGGEIRDEAAAGRGAASRAGAAGFVVSNLGFHCGKMPAAAVPKGVASPLEIISDGPLGVAAFGNEFGRPNLAGFFRSYESELQSENESESESRRFGFHKPVMLAAGLGHMLPHSAGKKSIPAGALIVQLGGPGFRIGMGGGAASSRSADEPDFNSVQRDNPEMQRRAQEVLDALRRLPGGGPALSLHDVGAGGIGNAVAEMAHDAGRGVAVRLRDAPAGERGMSPAEIWCNESQERYVLALPRESLEAVARICEREKCPMAVLGEFTETKRIRVVDENENAAVDLDSDFVMDPPPLPVRDAPSPKTFRAPIFSGGRPDLRDCAYAVLRHPTVACKRFLVNIADRTVGGLTARDQTVGKFQIPVADCAAFFHDYESFGGCAFALGERPPVAALDPQAGARMAVAEALTNLCAANVGAIRNVKFSLNWMANCADPVRDGELQSAVFAAADFCKKIGAAVIVGKDSLSMKTPAADGGAAVESPAMAVAAAFAPTADARDILTPVLSGRDDSLLMLALPGGDPAPNRLGGSALAQAIPAATTDAREGAPPDVCADALAKLWRALTECRRRNLILSQHDRSDGGLFAAACEMAFASGCGVSLALDALCAVAPETDGGEKIVNAESGGLVPALFSEEIGVLLEIPRGRAAEALRVFADCGLPHGLQTAGRPIREERLRIYFSEREVLNESVADLHSAWDETSFRIALRRDNPDCARAEHSRVGKRGGGGGGVRGRILIFKKRIRIEKRVGKNGWRFCASRAATDIGRWRRRFRGRALRRRTRR